MCKHIAAVLYGIGARLDNKPELLFFLRAVDPNDMLAHVDTSVPLSKQSPKAGKLLEADDMSQLFGLDMAEEDITSTEQETPRPTAKTVGKSSPTKRPKQITGTETQQEKKVWQKIEDLIATRTPSGYSKATAQLLKLFNSTRKAKTIESFSQRLTALRVRHKRKTRFMEGLNAIKELQSAELATVKPDNAAQVTQRKDQKERERLKQIVEREIAEFLISQKGKST